MYDKFGFKKLMSFVYIMILILSSTFYFIIEIKPLVVIYLIFISSFAAAPFTLIPSAVQEIFDVKFAGEVYGGTFYAFGLASILAPILSKILDLSGSKTNTPYLFIYLSGGILSLIGMIFLYFLNINKYKYSFY